MVDFLMESVGIKVVLGCPEKKGHFFWVFEQFKEKFDVFAGYGGLK